MKITRTRYAWIALALSATLAAAVFAQEPAAPPALPQPAPAQVHNNVRKGIRWTAFEYTCEGETRLSVYLGDQLAKIRFGDKDYLLHTTLSADGNRYSDGKVVWWGKGNGGFLQEDTPEGNGKMIAQGCKLDEPLTGAAVTGTVTYLERMALPPNAVMQVQLLDVSLADAPSKVIAEQSTNLGQHQVPVPFTLSYDPAKIDEKHSYSASAKITVEGKVWFASDRSYPVVTKGNPTHADITLKQVVAAKTQP
jgi:putative lipoprotein